uniref:Receptor-interacting serine/threonine-protein kinase 1-like n=1 Tax=Ciona intestinalis TaxID=7719 RepID=F6RIZ5_CIOIN|nr:receptor-interacting serine/threonine-protein kinase 1-like [Ciona intestinalis]|eukprot:XP_002123667.1 receptor-interacting serine/threonine-protein kinase 1-like [Ciona intestinalis]
MDVTKHSAKDFPSQFNDENFTLVGRGSFGEVRVCRHESLGSVALKLFYITGDKEKIEKAKKEFEIEAKVLYRMNHPHIVKFLGVVSLFQMDGIVMEYMTGGNMESLIKSDKELPLHERLRLLQELASAIKHIHTHDKKKAFIHSDIKPQNILLSENLELKLADFGSVNIKESTGVGTSTLHIPHSTQHTWPYTAPEFLSNLSEKKTTAMDIYSYGIIIYELLTRIAAYSDALVPKDVAQCAIVAKCERPNLQQINQAENDIKQDQKQDLQIFKTLRSMMIRCWDQEPTLRPNITQVLETLSVPMDKLEEATSILGIKDKQKSPENKTPITSVTKSHKKLNKTKLAQKSEPAYQQHKPTPVSKTVPYVSKPYAYQQNNFFPVYKLYVVNKSINKKVKLVKADITTLKVDAIVSATNTSLIPGGGNHVDDAIHKVAGEGLLQACIKLSGCPVGEAKITPGFNLLAKHVIHTVGPVGMVRDKLQSAYIHCLKLVLDHGLKSIAFPCISTGMHAYPSSEAAKVALFIVREWLSEHHESIDRIIFCVYNDLDYVIYEELMKQYFPTKTEKGKFYSS